MTRLVIFLAFGDFGYVIPTEGEKGAREKGERRRREEDS